MKRRPAAISSFTRYVWLTLTIYLLVLYGPVKKLIEIRLDKGSITQKASSSSSADKKLKTWYREKRDIEQLVTIDVQQSPFVPVLLFCIGAILLLIAPQKEKAASHLAYTPVAQQVPLYLQQCRIRV